MLSRTQIRHFLAVVDSGNFTRAAAVLNLTQPSLSGGIAELERQLGAQLFIRERRRIRLTPAGNALLPFARSIERDFYEAARLVSSLPVPSRPVRLGVLESVSTQWLERALKSCSGSIAIELSEGIERELQASIQSGSIDCALTLIDKASTADLLLEEPYCLALPLSHPLSGRTVVAAEEVAGETMIARRSCEILPDVSRFFTDRGVRPRFSLRSANDDRAMAMVGAGLGVTVAPRSLGRADVAMIPLADLDRSRRVGLVYGNHCPEEIKLILSALRMTSPS